MPQPENNNSEVDLKETLPGNQTPVEVKPKEEGTSTVTPSQVTSPVEPIKKKIKVDGEEIELTEEELIQYAQMGHGAQKRFAEAARIKQDAQTVLSYLDKDQKAALRQIFLHKAGGDQAKAEEMLYEFGEHLVAEKLERSQLTPEEKEALERKAALDAQEAALKKREETWVEQQQQILVRQHEEQLDKDLPAIIQKVGLPDTKHVRRRILEYARWALGNGADLPLEILAREVKKETMVARKGLMAETTADQIKAEYPDLWKAIIKLYTDEIRGGTSTPKASTPKKDEAAQSGKGRSGPKKFSSFRELHEAVDARS